MRSAKIVGVGKYLPPQRLTNFDLEKMVNTTDEWITTRTGIKERRIASKGVGASMLAHKAARLALRRAELSARDLDVIIVATITPDTPFPAAACYLQHYLKARNASCFDISAACSGFVHALTCAWQDRSTCVLFGDGAGAAVVTACNKPGFLSSYLGGDGSQADLLIVPGGGSRMPPSAEVLEKRLQYIKMRGNELFRVAVRIMVKAAGKALSKAHLSAADVDILIPHQANKRIIDAVAKRLHISPEKIFLNVSRYGNMSSASTAVALCEAWEKGLLKKGDIVVLDAFGGGLVWGSCVIQWA